MEEAKTFSEMTVHERQAIIDVVADALEWNADKAFNGGDARQGANALNLAMAIRGSAQTLVTRNLRAAELLLQQGINLIAGDAQPTLAGNVH